MDEYQEESVVEASVDAEQEYETPIDQDEAVTAPEVDTPKPDKVGDAIKREVERREAALRRQYEEKYAPITQQNAYLEKQARIYGYATVDEYTRAVDEHLQQQEIDRAAQRMGVDPETYAQYFQPVNQKASELEQKVQALESQLTSRERQEQAQAQWGELYQSYPGLTEDSRAWERGENPSFYTQQMQELIDAGYKPVHAYELAHKDTLFRQKEQETIARLTGRDVRQVLPSTDSPNNMQFDPDNMTLDEIEAISARVRRGERITF